MTKKMSTELKQFLEKNNLEVIKDALLNSTDSKDYFDFSITDPKKISYLKGDRIAESTMLNFYQGYRKSKAFHTKIGRLVSDTVDNAIIIRASKLLYERVEKYDVRIVSDIKYYYLEDNYTTHPDFHDKGPLFSSCMRYDHLQDAIGLYESFGSSAVRLAVILDNDGGLLARALLWNCQLRTSEETVDIIYLDRVYAVDDNIEHCLYSWAEQQGYKPYNKGVFGSLSVDCSINDCDFVPYFDTFCYYDTAGTLRSDTGDVCLQETEGERLDAMIGTLCECCGDRRDTEFCEDVSEYRCESCREWSEYENCFLSLSNAVWSAHSRTYFAEGNDDFVYSEQSSDWIPYSEVIFDEDTEDYYTHKDYRELISEREAEIETV